MNTIRSARTRSLRTASRSKNHALLFRSAQFLSRYPEGTDKALAQRTGIKPAKATALRVQLSPKINHLLTRARRLLEQNEKITLDELAIQLGLTRRMAQIVWLNIPRVKRVMEYEEKKRKRR